ncbi:hypothetical protein SK128_009483, partial [Halocaridina rubra]
MRLHKVVIFVLCLRSNKNLESKADPTNGTESIHHFISGRGISQLKTPDRNSERHRNVRPNNTDIELLTNPKYIQETPNTECLHAGSNSTKDVAYLPDKSLGKNCPNQSKEKVLAGRTLASVHSSEATSQLFSTLRDDIVTVSAKVWDMVKRRVQGCHFVILTQDGRRPLTSHIIRRSAEDMHPYIVVDTTTLTEEKLSMLALNLLGGKTTICRTLFIDLTSGGYIFIFRLLASSKLWLWPATWIVILGDSNNARDVLSGVALRNALSPLYLGLPKSFLEDPGNKNIFSAFRASEMQQINSDTHGKSNIVLNMYGRCLYCDQGQPKILLLFSRRISEVNFEESVDPFQNQLRDLRGHRIKFVGMPTFPHNAFVTDVSGPKPITILQDSLDKRMLETIARKYNFTYEFQPPEDRQFGIPLDNGTWTGLVGAIQRGLADATTIIAINPERNKIFDHLRAYLSDPLAIVSPKPQLLPQFYLVLRPFTVDVWLYLLLSVLVWGAIFWFFLKCVASITGFYMSPVGSILYGWSILITNAPSRTPSNASAQVLLGWWLLACIAITTAYTSSLVSHLTVQTRTKPIDSFEDLVNLPNWKWGLEKLLYRSTVFSYFKENTNPNIKYIFQHLEVSLEHM